MPKNKTRNYSNLKPYPRQEQEIDPKILGNPRNTQEIYFLGKPKKTQEILFLGFSWVSQDLGFFLISCLGFFLFLGPRNLRKSTEIEYHPNPRSWHTQENPRNFISWVFLGLPKKFISWVFLGLPKKTQERVFLGLPKKTQEIKFLVLVLGMGLAYEYFLSCLGFLVFGLASLNGSLTLYHCVTNSFI